MKTILAAILAVLSINSAYADGYGHRHGRHEWRNEWRHERSDPGRWIVPALVGGFIGYELARPHVAYAPPVYQPAVVVREQAYVVPPPQPVYREVIEYDPACGCYMHIQRQIGWR